MSITITINGTPYPTYIDVHGTQRFPRNSLFCHLVDSGRVDLNQLVRDYVDGLFAVEEYLHFLMGLGWSVSAFSDLRVCDDVEIDNPLWEERSP